MFGHGSRWPLKIARLHEPRPPYKRAPPAAIPRSHPGPAFFLAPVISSFASQLCVASNTHTNTQTDRQTDRQTTERETEKMPMERSMSCAERSTFATAPPANDLRCHSASYAASFAPHKKMQRAKSTASAVQPVQRSGSTRTVSGGAGLNLRCYSASYAASYNPLSDGGGGAAQANKGPSSATAAPVWRSAGRRSLNLRSYTPSFAALVDDVPPAPTKKASAVVAAPGGDAEAELQRKKRLVAYKVYDVEGKVKGSVKRSVKWIKVKCSRAVHGC